MVDKVLITFNHFNLKFVIKLKLKQKMQQKTINNQLNSNEMRRKTFLVEKFINVLIIARMYLTQVPLWMWTMILILLYIWKLRRQGNTPSGVYVVLAMICSIFGDYLKIDFVFLIAPILAGVSHFFSCKTYWFPKSTNSVGMREQILQNDTYLLELYPVIKNENTQKKVIKWNHTIEMKKILEYEEHRGPIVVAFLKFFWSALTKVKLTFIEGQEQHTNHAIIFSHGRTSTPLMYSQILTRVISLESQKFGVLAVQHNDKSQTGQTEEHKIKRFRQMQVQARAIQMHNAVQHCSKKKHIVLMGHSYGGATTIQTYHCLPQELKQKVSHIILLDPWLFPLTEGKLMHEISCPVLILANQHFIDNEDVYNRNKQFIKHHKKDQVTYMVWKNGEHLHQSDLCFLFGNKIKHSQLSMEMMNKNVKAIDMFLSQKHIKAEKMREAFCDEILPWDYKPDKWNNYLTL